VLEIGGGVDALLAGAERGSLAHGKAKGSTTEINNSNGGALWE